jgi:hypothetical protein
VLELERGLEDAYKFMSDVSSIGADGIRFVSNLKEAAPRKALREVLILHNETNQYNCSCQRYDG